MPLVPLVSQFDHGGQLKHWSVTFSCTSLMKIFDPSTKSWRQHFLPEMGTMAAWFGCLIIIQLFLFLSKIFSYHTINLNHKWAWSCLQHALSNCKRVKIKLPLIEKLIYAFVQTSQHIMIAFSALGSAPSSRELHFAIVLDAGSSGTRAYLYRLLLMMMSLLLLLLSLLLLLLSLLLSLLSLLLSSSLLSLLLLLLLLYLYSYRSFPDYLTLTRQNT